MVAITTAEVAICLLAHSHRQERQHQGPATAAELGGGAGSEAAARAGAAAADGAAAERQGPQAAVELRAAAARQRRPAVQLLMLLRPTAAVKSNQLHSVLQNMLHGAEGGGSERVLQCCSFGAGAQPAASVAAAQERSLGPRIRARLRVRRVEAVTLGCPSRGAATLKGPGREAALACTGERQAPRSSAGRRARC